VMQIDTKSVRQIKRVTRFLFKAETVCSPILVKILMINGNVITDRFSFEQEPCHAFDLAYALGIDLHHLRSLAW
jgi:hypothetical protein